MSSIVYNGHDLSPYVTAELVEPAGHALSPRALMVPGRPGAALLDCELPPRVLRVRLFLDAGISLGADERSEIRHVLYGWLVAPSGAELELPGEPGLSWRDAVVTDASDWDSLFEDGSCELAFTCFDPVAYGEGKSGAASTLTVGGTWATWPVVTLTALAGSSVKVADGLGRYVLVERDFAAGDVVKVYQSGTDTCLGRGTVNYSSAELREIMGLTTSKAAARFPGRPPEVIHQDNYAHIETEVSE